MIPTNQDEYDLWKFQKGLLDEPLKRIEQAERAILVELGCPTDTVETRDHGRVARFEQEARAASALNHPCLHHSRAGHERGGVNTTSRRSICRAEGLDPKPIASHQFASTRRHRRPVDSSNVVLASPIRVSSDLRLSLF
jgi:hypothetical protein